MPVPRTAACGLDVVAEKDAPAADMPGCRRRGPSLDKTAQTQRQITEAALAIFLEQGITRTTMAQIATQAGVAKGTIYSYYPSKEALLRGVVVQALAQSAAYQPLCRRPGETAQALLRRSLLPTMEAIERGGLARLILTEAKQHPELARLYKELAFAPWQQHVLGILQLACDEGELRSANPQDCARLLASPFWMGMVHNGLLTDDPLQHVAIAPLMEQLIALLFASPASSSPPSSPPSRASSPKPSHPLPTRSQP